VQGSGGRLLLLNQSRDHEVVESHASTGWVAAPVPGDLLCFDGSLLHAVLPGVLGFDTSAVEGVQSSAAIEELRTKVKSGQQRMSLNLAFWCEIGLFSRPVTGLD